MAAGLICLFLERVDTVEGAPQASDHPNGSYSVTVDIVYMAKCLNDIKVGFRTCVRLKRKRAVFRLLCNGSLRILVHLI